MPSRLDHLECAACGKRHDPAVVQQRCACGGTLLCRYNLSGLMLADVRSRPPGTWRYRELLPIEGDPVSLGEPETATLFAPRLSERWGIEAWIKDESTLPGATFKARGACVGLSRAVELGVKRVVMPTAGNAGGTWSLYAARAGIEITVVMSATAPRTNQLEVTAAGGTLELVDGSIADAAVRAKEIADETGAFFAATFYEPYRLEGKKAAWLESFDSLGDADSMSFPATIVLPVGGGVAAIAAAKVAAEVRELGWSNDRAPRLVGVQAANCAPIVKAFEEGRDDVPPWTGDPHTVAAGLRVPAPIEGPLVMETIRASGGTMVAVEEDRIVESMRDLAATEGLLACPEGATTVDAAEQLVRAGDLDGPVLLYNTGAGQKYLDVLTD
ncbi:MAG TPA: threonine synthase [Actinomycetota bacterium]|nr:threonine synthase [Actinomycetota bacterium]